MRTYYHLKNWRAVQMLYAKHSFDQAVRILAGRPFQRADEILAGAVNGG